MTSLSELLKSGGEFGTQQETSEEPATREKTENFAEFLRQGGAAAPAASTLPATTDSNLLTMLVLSPGGPKDSNWPAAIKFPAEVKAGLPGAPAAAPASIAAPAFAPGLPVERAAGADRALRR